jgi:two-component system alkaline phosphatase synthesis response regulator PhoP
VISGIEVGAEDYVVKPFSPKVLVARVTSILRRQDDFFIEDSASSSERISLFENRLVIDTARHRVLVDHEVLTLTFTEFSLLRYLASRPGFVRSRDQIIAAVHGRSTVLSTRTVDVHITALRRKLGELGKCIETVRGVGYRFQDGIHAATQG